MKRRGLYIIVSTALLLSIGLFVPGLADSLELKNPILATAAPATAGLVMPKSTPDIAQIQADKQVAQERRIAKLSALESIRKLSSTKEEKLARLCVFEQDQGALFPRTRVEIEQGTIPERITLAEAQEIVAQNKGAEYNNIVKLLSEAHGGADEHSGSGIDMIRLWLNDEATIVISMSLGEIRYGNGIESILLYPMQQK